MAGKGRSYTLNCTGVKEIVRVELDDGESNRRLTR